MGVGNTSMKSYFCTLKILRRACTVFTKCRASLYMLYFLYHIESMRFILLFHPDHVHKNEFKIIRAYTHINHA